MTKPTEEKQGKYELTEAEWSIMRHIWDNGASTAGMVQEALEKSKGWAYSTVKTTMDRMVKKNLLFTERIRNLQLFKACISREQAQKGEFQKMLSRAFNGALTPMMQFLLENEEISKNELDELRQMIEDKKS